MSSTGPEPGRARDPSLQDILVERQKLLTANPAVSSYSLWYPREQGQWADAVSKQQLPYPESAPGAFLFIEGYKV